MTTTPSTTTASFIRESVTNTLKACALVFMLYVAVDAAVVSTTVLSGLSRVAALLSIAAYAGCVALLLKVTFSKDAMGLTKGDASTSRQQQLVLWMLTGGVTLTIGYSYSTQFTSLLGALLMQNSALRTLACHIVILLSVYSVVAGSSNFQMKGPQALIIVLMTGSTLIVPLWYLGGVTPSMLRHGLVAPPNGLIVVGFLSALYGVYNATSDAVVSDDQDHKYSEIEVDMDEL